MTKHNITFALRECVNHFCTMCAELIFLDIKINYVTRFLTFTTDEIKDCSAVVTKSEYLDLMKIYKMCQSICSS